MVTNPLTTVMWLPAAGCFCCCLQGAGLHRPAVPAVLQQPAARVQAQVSTSCSRLAAACSGIPCGGLASADPRKLTHEPAVVHLPIFLMSGVLGVWLFLRRVCMSHPVCAHAAAHC